MTRCLMLICPLCLTRYKVLSSSPNWAELCPGCRGLPVDGIPEPPLGPEQPEEGLDDTRMAKAPQGLYGPFLTISDHRGRLDSVVSQEVEEPVQDYSGELHLEALRSFLQSPCVTRRRG